jgi:RNA polymerase primary sigma factor
MRSSAYAPLLPKPQDAQTPFELLRDKNLRDQVSELLEVLDDRERKIIFQRFGLDGGNPKTLEVVGKKFGVTRERIRQLQNVALDKLRRALRNKETPQAAPVVATGAPFRLPQAKAAHRAAKATLHLVLEPEIISSRQF